jgi:hypothetical protein
VERRGYHGVSLLDRCVADASLSFVVDEKPRAGSRIAASRRGAEKLRCIALAALALAALGPDCNSNGIRVTQRPPDPVLVDARGDVDRDGVDALIAAIEEQRGLRFIQHPTLEPIGVDDPRLESLVEAARALEPCPRADAGSDDRSALVGRCFPDPSLEWIDCVAPPDLEQARRALRRLLDAQNHPRLVAMAPGLRGDPGVAVRALLAASANGATAREAPRDAEPFDLFELPTIDLERDDAAAGGCVAIAEHFLMAQEDRDAPFLRPPLSTKQLVSPKRHRAGERPVLLVGSPPALAGCSVTSDESVGVARLLDALLAKGGSIPGPLLGEWRGDRGVRFACGDRGARWIYVAELSRAERAVAFAEQIGRILPDDFAGPSSARAIGSRVVVVSRGLDAAGARAWAAALIAREIVELQGAD